MAKPNEAMPNPIWRRPTASEAAMGYIAMQKQVFYCQHPTQARWPTGEILREVDYSGGYTDKATGQFIPRREVWQGVTAQGMERRVQRGEELPYWVTKRERGVV